MINPKEVNATSRVDHEHPEAVLAGAAGGGWRRELIASLSGPDELTQDCSDFPLPRWGVLSGKSGCTSRRLRLFLVQFESFGAGKESGMAL
jgi:hypothetical protein